jgi:hypothetical protein
VKYASIALFGLSLCLASAALAEQVAILHAAGVPQTAFAADEIRLALQAKGDSVVAGTLDDVAKTSANVRIILAASADEARQLAGRLGLAPLKGTAYCDRLLAGKPMDGITPPQVADALERDAQTTLKLLSELPSNPAGKELRLTLGDLRAMAHLGNYYAEKIRAATDLALFDRTGKPEHQSSAIRHLESALAQWKSYAAAASAQYRPQLLTRIGHVDLNALTEKVAADSMIARQWKGK